MFFFTKSESGRVECNIDILAENILLKVRNFFAQTSKIVHKKNSKKDFSSKIPYGHLESSFD